MRSHRDRRAMAKWEQTTADWAYHAARDLVIDIHTGQLTGATPYQVGVRLLPGETAWIEIPARLRNETLQQPGAESPIRSWLITDQRIVGRLGDEWLVQWPWSTFSGCRVSLAPGSEFVVFDLPGEGQVTWDGPGVAPLAVAGLQRLYGTAALLDHPGLAPL